MSVQMCIYDAVSVYTIAARTKLNKKPHVSQRMRTAIDTHQVQLAQHTTRLRGGGLKVWCVTYGGWWWSD